MRLRAAVTSSFVAQATQVAASIATVRLLVGAFGAETYGYWSAILGLTLYLGILNMGTAQAVSAKVSTTNWATDPEGIARAVQLGVLGTLRVSIAALPLVAVATWFFPWARVFHLEGPLAGGARLAALAVLGSYVLELPFLAFRTALSGMGEITVERAITTTAALLRLVAALAFSRLHPALWWAVLLLSVINQLGMLACMVALRRRVPGLWKKGAARVDETERARFRTWRVDFLIIQITGAVLWGSDTLLAGALVDAAASARVAVAVRAYGIVNIFATVVGSALGPALAQEWARGDLARARRVGLEATQLVGGVVIVCVLGLLSAGNAIVDLWVGPGVFTGQVAWSAYGVLFGVEGFVSVAYAFTTQAGQHRAFARWSVGEALLKLGLAWFLSRFLGIAGVALGSAIAHVAIAGWVLPRTYAQALGTSTVGYIVGAARPALVGTTAFIAFYGAARLLYPHPGKLATVAIGTASGVAFVIAFLALGIGTELRGRLASMIPFRKR